MSDDFITHLNASRFMAQRSIFAQTVDVEDQHPQTFALPGALAPIHRDRLEAHQDDGLTELEIVRYENERHMQTTVGLREKHAAWVSRDYDAQVSAQREIEAQKRAQEMQAAAAYQQKLAEILARKDRDA